MLNKKHGYPESCKAQPVSICAVDKIVTFKIAFLDAAFAPKC